MKAESNRVLRLFLEMLLISIAVSLFQVMILTCMGYKVVDKILGKVYTNAEDTETHESAQELADYYTKLQQLGVFDNSPDEAFPQTVVHKLVTEHFSAPLPPGKTVKKAIILGYDGFRADALGYIKDEKQSALMRIKNQGGNIYHAFAGGVAGENEQPTVSAPGWLSVLTGGWADYHGVYDNAHMKNQSETFLTELARNGVHTSLSFSWRDFVFVACKPEVAHAIQENLPAQFNCTSHDSETYFQTLRYFSQPNEVERTLGEIDLFFVYFAKPDSAGHTYGFYNNPDYAEACKTADAEGYDILEAIESREAYSQEDWLKIVITDHGGVEMSHGGQTLPERAIWIALNRGIPATEEYSRYARKSN